MQYNLPADRTQRYIRKMTDSMKFGPEWLRNLSTDSSTNSTAMTCNSGSGVNCNSTIHNVNLNMNLANSKLNQGDSINMAIPGQQRSLFPQFRYGREELLSLFDKNCDLPQILPEYKKLFVNKVQVPLALTPSTDEEVFTQSVPLSTARTTWIRKSPIGFPPLSRVSGRGGNSIDRGRMRGKPIYHPIYQRSNSNINMYEESRTPLIKPERSWVERNGIGDGTDGVFTSVGILAEWSGTSSSSPRKELCSHSRNVENWRKNRVEDCSAEVPSSVIVCSEGWRGSNYGSSKWGRSSSWREEESSSNTTEAYSDSVVLMQRQFSNISSITDRGNSGGVNNISKSSATSSGPNIRNNQSCSRQSEGAASDSKNDQWTTCADSGDDLPEWAMENPDSGGTFDASGAFHGSMDYSSSGNKNYPYTNTIERKVIHEEIPQKSIINNSMDENKIQPEQNCQKTCGLEKPGLENDLQPLPASQKHHNTTIKSTNEIIKLLKNTKSEQLSISTESNELASKLMSMPALTTEIIENDDIGSILSEPSVAPRKVSQSDISDRMQEVADDMVEKLIMDDDMDSIKILNQASTAEQQISIHIGTSSSSLHTISASQNGMPLLCGDLVLNHTSMHQHHTQQQQLVAVPASANLQTTMNSTSSSDMWFYQDPQSKVQGPFTAMEMTDWYRAGYFDENLFVRRACDTCFRALGDLIKLCHGNMPFTHNHLIPLSLDNVNLVSNTIPEIRPVKEKTTQASSDFVLNQLQQQENREELKGNVTAAADSLNDAVKNLINPVDVSHILTMQLQLLQQQYLRHQEMLVIAEYSAKECFQRLSPAERETIVRQKVQMLGLPEYLVSLAGLGNSLANLNISAGNQLYDFLAAYSKKEQPFSNHSTQTEHTQSQLSVTNSLLDCDNFMINSQKHHAFANITYGVVGSSENNSETNEDISRNDLINDYNVGLLLSRNNITAQHSQQLKPPSTLKYENEFLTQQQLIAVASPSPVLQMWIPHINTNNNAQQQFLSQMAPTLISNNLWTGNSLSQLPNLATVGPTTIPSTMPVKSIPSSMWEILPMEQNQEKQFQTNAINFNDQMDTTSQLRNTKKEQKIRPCIEIEEKLENLQSNPSCSHVLEGSVKNLILSPNQPTILTGKSKDEDVSERLNEHRQLQQQQVSSSKRANSKSQILQASKKEESAVNKKGSEEERRRDAVEEKRRQKDERKRHQAEEEKRRFQLLEEEKNRQVLEEKERQQQIQTQRRKALFGSVTSVTSVTSVNSLPITAITKSAKEHRIQSSVAPWSSQSAASINNTGPSLAEIQKAERRERRADQLRQNEIQEKQMRSTTVSAENNDCFLKWNASPVPVKSLVQIQAEESKRLIEDQLDCQRRKELEHENIIVSNSGLAAGHNNGAGTSSTNLSAIWSGSKVWGATSIAGFWEEPIKFSSALASAPASNTGASSVGKSQSPHTNTKYQSGQQNVPASSTNRNIAKSQTVTTMQNAHSGPKNHSGVPVTLGIHAQKQQKSNSNTIDKKNGNFKNQPTQNTYSVNSSYALTKKKDDYQTEFTGWCLKTLGGMNVKVDVPTFVTFLQDLESPYEVKDYVRMYLGENKEFTEFAKQFLERRSKYNNIQRAQNAHNDDMCKPAPAITPSSNDSLENKGKQKKIKKGKMTKLDARILGFSVTAAEGRINVGDRDYVDAP